MINRNVFCKAAFLLFSALMTSVICGARCSSLEKELLYYVGSCHAKIGVAVITDTNDTVCVNNDRRYPMNSVMKLYQAMAVVETMQNKGISLDSLLFISDEDLHPETYSPMRDACPKGNFRISVAGLLKYSLQQSDNNACDILFDRIVGTNDTDGYIRSLGIDGFAIKVNEKEMFNNHELSVKNWNYPLSAAALINKLFTERLYLPVYNEFLMETLVSCNTGQKRLSAPLLSTGAVIGHKTGTGFTSPEGLPQGINDVGFVMLPDGRHYAIAVFIESSCCNMDETERMIADISGLVYKSFMKE